jgi:hypothetical protein
MHPQKELVTCGWGYVKIYALTEAEDYRSPAGFCLDWLMRRRSCGYDQYYWGNDFSFSTRDAVVGVRCPRVKLQAERHAEVVRGLPRHAAITAGMSGFAPALAPASYAGERANPGLERFVARGSLRVGEVARPCDLRPGSPRRSRSGAGLR